MPKHVSEHLEQRQGAQEYINRVREPVSPEISSNVAKGYKSCNARDNAERRVGEEEWERTLRMTKN